MTAAKLTRGETWRAEVEELYELQNPAEQLLVAECAATIDAVDAAPNLAEKRQQRVLLSRLLGQLNLPALDGTTDRPAMDGRSVRSRRASNIRWQRERDARGA